MFKATFSTNLTPPIPTVDLEMPFVMLKNPEALSSDQLRMIADAFPDLPSIHGLQSEYERMMGKMERRQRGWENNLKFCRFYILDRQRFIPKC